MVRIGLDVGRIGDVEVGIFVEVRVGLSVRAGVCSTSLYQRFGDECI